MNKPMVRIHNTETDQVLDREMTATEFEKYEAKQATIATAKAEAEAKAIAKAAILDRLGLTEQEAALLLP